MCTLSSCPGDIFDVAVAEGSSNEEFWWKVLLEANVEGNDEVVQSEILEELAKRFYAGFRSAV